VEETGLRVESLRGRVRGFFHACQWEVRSMAAKAIVALLVLGCLPALGQSPPGYIWPQHPRLTGRLQGPPAEIRLLPERSVGHRL
jgi:hypothetical protein